MRRFGQSLLLFQPAVLLSLSSQLAHPHVLAHHVRVHHGRCDERRNTGYRWKKKSEIDTLMQNKHILKCLLFTKGDHLLIHVLLIAITKCIFFYFVQ